MGVGVSTKENYPIVRFLYWLTLPSAEQHTQFTERQMVLKMGKSNNNQPEHNVVKYSSRFLFPAWIETVGTTEANKIYNWFMQYTSSLEGVHGESLTLAHLVVTAVRHIFFKRWFLFRDKRTRLIPDGASEIGLYARVRFHSFVRSPCHCLRKSIQC
jgi:hypothetical protein